MVMGLNRGYETRFDVVTPSQPFWNYHGFLPPWGNFLSSSVSGLKEKLLSCCLLRVDQYLG